MGWQIHLPLVLEVVQDRVKVFIYSPSTRSLAVFCVGVAVGRGGKGAIVCNRETLQIDRNAARAHSGICGVDGGGIVDDAHAAIGGCGIILEIFKSVHVGERREIEKRREKREERVRVEYESTKLAQTLFCVRSYGSHVVICSRVIAPIQVSGRLC